MGLETGTYISDLVATNPIGASDQKAQGDDHIRLIKSTLLATFPSITGAVNATHTQLNQLSSLAAVSVLGRSANSSGAPAAIAAGANDRILRRVSDAIGFGQLTAGMFPNTVVPDAALSSNVALRNASNTFSKAYTGGGTIDPAILVQSSNPVVQLNDTDGTSGSRRANIQIVNDAVNIFGRNEADDATTATLARFFIDGSEIELSATLLDFNGALDLSGKLTGAGGLAIQGAYSSGVTGVHAWADVNGSLARFGAATTGGSRAALGLWGSSLTLDLNGGVFDCGSHTVTTPNASASEVGYKGAPQSRAISASSNTAASDQGGTVRFSGGSGQTFTLDTDLPQYAVILIVNASGNDWTIAASSSLIWALTGGTGSRTLADGGMAVAYHRGAGVYNIGGGGLS